MQSPLPPAWIESLFARLMTRYGSAWMRMWEGIDPAAVKADWSEELAGFQNRPKALKYALEYLPDRPPNVQQFKAICARAPEPTPPALPPPVTSPEVVAAALERMRATPPPSHWALRLRAREVSLEERLTSYQRRAWREALGEQA